MTSELWVLVVNTLFLAACALATIRRIHGVYSQVLEHTQAEQKALQRLLKDAQDRIHAASLSDYMAIRSRQGEVPPRSFTHTDEGEAQLEEARLNGGRY